MPDETSTAPPAHESLALRVLRGLAWSYSGAVVVIAAQLLYTALTARLISPAEFGAYATAQAMLSLVGYFTLSTVGNALIRHPSLDRQVVGTAIVLTGVAGGVVASVVLLTSDLWTDIWRSPGAASLLRLFAPQVVLGALAIVPLGLLRRGLRYRAVSLIETSSVLIGFAVGAALAFQLRSAEALVVGQVVTAAALLAASVTATRSELGIAYSRQHARELFSFSAQVSLQNLGHYVNNTLPSFAVSRSLGQASLGFFSRGSLLVGLPLTFLAQGVNKTLYPIYPRFRTARREECRRMMVDVACVTTMFAWPLFAALAGLAPLVVEVLLGSEWVAVASIVGPLCLYAAVNFAYTVFASFAEAFGYLRQIWFVQACWTLTLGVALVLAVRGDAGMRMIVLVAAGVQIAVHALQLGLLARVRSVDASHTLHAELWAAGLAAVWYIATMLTSNALADNVVAVRLLASCGVVALLAVLTLLALPHLPAGRALRRRGIRVPWAVRSHSG